MNNETFIGGTNNHIEKQGTTTAIKSSVKKAVCTGKLIVSN